MCEKCVAAFREIFPDIPDIEMFNVLMGFTCFPFGTPEQTREQLEELKRQGFGVGKSTDEIVLTEEEE